MHAVCVCPSLSLSLSVYVCVCMCNCVCEWGGESVSVCLYVRREGWTNLHWLIGYSTQTKFTSVSPKLLGQKGIFRTVRFDTTTYIKIDMCVCVCVCVCLSVHGCVHTYKYTPVQEYHRRPLEYCVLIWQWFLRTATRVRGLSYCTRCPELKGSGLNGNHCNNY